MNKLIAFFEIPAINFGRAVDFYEYVLGVKLSVFECEEEKMACFEEEGETIGAIFYAPDFLSSQDGSLTHFYPSENGVLIHFNCEDMEDTLNKVLRKGGKIVIPKTKIEAEGKGWFAVFTDSEGNRVGVSGMK